MISEDYHEILQHWGTEQFYLACKEYLISGKYFPKVSELLTLLGDISRREIPGMDGQKQLTEEGSYKSEVDRLKNHLKFRAMAQKIAKLITEDELLELIDKIESGEVTELKDYERGTT